MSIKELYDQTIKHLSTSDRLRLATAILKDIPPQAVVDYSEEWSEQDLGEFSTASWEHADASLGKEEDA